MQHFPAFLSRPVLAFFRFFRLLSPFVDPTNPERIRFSPSFLFPHYE